MELTLYQLYHGFHKLLTHLDQRVLYIHCDHPVKPNDFKCITNEGMGENEKGNLYIHFKISHHIEPSLLNKLKLFYQEETEQENKIKEKNVPVHTTDIVQPDLIRLIYFQSIYQEGHEPTFVPDQEQGQEPRQCVHQ